MTLVLNKSHHNQTFSLSLFFKAYFYKAYFLFSLEDSQNMLRQKLVYCPAAPSESRV